MSVSAVFVVSVSCVLVCVMCRCERGMCVVIVWLIVSAQTTVL